MKQEKKEMLLAFVFLVIDTFYPLPTHTYTHFPNLLHFVLFTCNALIFFLHVHGGDNWHWNYTQIILEPPKTVKTNHSQSPLFRWSCSVCVGLVDAKIGGFKSSIQKERWSKSVGCILQHEIECSPNLTHFLFSTGYFPHKVISQ